jgi:hypothetical protein
MGECESCGAAGETRLDDGSVWCLSCDLAACEFEAEESR